MVTRYVTRGDESCGDRQSLHGALLHCSLNTCQVTYDMTPRTVGTCSLLKDWVPERVAPPLPAWSTGGPDLHEITLLLALIGIVWPNFSGSSEVLGFIYMEEIES